MPFREPVASQPLNQQFNFALSSARIKIEHAFGVLKNRLGSLVSIPIQMQTEEANIWVMVCVCLHNLILTVDGKSDAMLNDPTLVPATATSRSQQPGGRVEQGTSSREDVRAGERLRESIALHIQTLQDALYKL